MESGVCVHVLQHTTVVVLHGDLIPVLYQESISHCGVANVVGHRCDYAGESFQRGQVGVESPVRTDEQETVEYIRCVACVVVRVLVVVLSSAYLLHGLEEPIEKGVLDRELLAETPLVAHVLSGDENTVSSGLEYKPDIKVPVYPERLQGLV